MSAEGVLLLVGPTCSGKTTLALELAERFQAEIVGADSRQIYAGMPVGTAAPSVAEQARVPHHLVGFLEPSERYSAARFASDALAAIEAIRARGRRALVVGGTGFYVRALAGDVTLCAAYDPGLRARLAREASLHPPHVLHAWLAARAPERAAALAPSDRYRITRALEIVLAEPPPVSNVAGVGDDGKASSEPAGATVVSAPVARSLRSAGLAFAKIGLEIAPGALDARIERRVEAMLAAGFVEEAERVGARAVAGDAIGYREALAYLRGRATLPELRRLLVRNTRRYAKRQRTWFRHEPGVTFVGASDVAERVSSLLAWS